MSEFDFFEFQGRLKKAVVKAGGNKAVASKINKKDGFVSKMQTGDSKPSIEAAALVAEACNTSLDWLVYGKEDQIDDASFERMLDQSSLKQAMIFVLDEYQRKNGMVVSASSEVIADKMLGVFLEIIKK